MLQLIFFTTLDSRMSELFMSSQLWFWAVALPDQLSVSEGAPNQKKADLKDDGRMNRAPTSSSIRQIWLSIMQRFSLVEQGIKMFS